MLEESTFGGIGQRQRSDWESLLAAEVKRLAARHKDRQFRTELEERGNDRRRGEDVFEVVKEWQDVAWE